MISPTAYDAGVWRLWTLLEVPETARIGGVVQCDCASYRIVKVGAHGKEATRPGFAVVCVELVLKPTKAACVRP